MTRWAYPTDEDVAWGETHGYGLARCPGCGQRQLTAVEPVLRADGAKKSGADWPVCRVCSSGTRVEPLGDVTRVRRLRPGQPRTKTQLAEDGCIIRPAAVARSAPRDRRQPGAGLTVGPAPGPTISPCPTPSAEPTSDGPSSTATPARSSATPTPGPRRVRRSALVWLGSPKRKKAPPAPA